MASFINNAAVNANTATSGGLGQAYVGLPLASYGSTAASAPKRGKLAGLGDLMGYGLPYGLAQMIQPGVQAPWQGQASQQQLPQQAQLPQWRSPQPGIPGSGVVQPQWNMQELARYLPFWNFNAIGAQQAPGPQAR